MSEREREREKEREILEEKKTPKEMKRKEDKRKSQFLQPGHHIFSRESYRAKSTEEF